jgi:predicted ATP-dependent serine protease
MTQRFRTLRGQKNRFGAVNELGIFAMTEAGLREVRNPSAIFLERGEAAAAGSVVMVLWEGTRPLLVEIQALVDDSPLGNPRRLAVGLEQNRLALLLAVLHRHGGLQVGDQDVFANVVGGVRVLETSADLALLLAIVSSFRDRALPRDLVVFGEVGLSGEIRPVPSGQERIAEAAKHGFTRAVVPRGNAPRQRARRHAGVSRGARWPRRWRSTGRLRVLRRSSWQASCRAGRPVVRPVVRRVDTAGAADLVLQRRGSSTCSASRARRGSIVGPSTCCTAKPRRPASTCCR